jgi:dTMP kinase
VTATPGAGAQGRLIAFEGIDGCGKSTQARRLAQVLGAELTFEPGATALGASLRSLLLDADRGELGARVEALLMIADRADHVDRVIAPALQSGRWVVTDRYSASTLAYQGSGRGIDTDILEPLIRFAEHGVQPDLSVFLDVPVEVGAQRIAAAKPDRLERLDTAFFERVRRGFSDQAASDPGRWVVIDGVPDEETVWRSVAQAVASRFDIEVEP